LCFVFFGGGCFFLFVWVFLIVSKAPFPPPSGVNKGGWGDGHQNSPKKNHPQTAKTPPAAFFSLFLFDTVFLWSGGPPEHIFLTHTCLIFLCFPAFFVSFPPCPRVFGTKIVGATGFCWGVGLASGRGLPPPFFFFGFPNILLFWG